VVAKLISVSQGDIVRYSVGAIARCATDGKHPGELKVDQDGHRRS
jgi:hypothetical protein